MKMTTKDIRMRRNCKIYVAGTHVPLTQEAYGGECSAPLCPALLVFILFDFGVQIEK